MGSAFESAFKNQRTWTKNGEVALGTDLLPCHSYSYGTKRKAKDITGTKKLVYHIKMVNGIKKKY